MFDWDKVAVWSLVFVFCMSFWYFKFKFGYGLVMLVFGG